MIVIDQKSPLLRGIFDAIAQAIPSGTIGDVKNASQLVYLMLHRDGHVSSERKPGQS